MYCSAMATYKTHALHKHGLCKPTFAIATFSLLEAVHQLLASAGLLIKKLTALPHRLEYPANFKLANVSHLWQSLRAR